MQIKKHQILTKKLESNVMQLSKKIKNDKNIKSEIKKVDKSFKKR